MGRVTHLTAGKRRVAALLAQADGARELRVWSLEGRSESPIVRPKVQATVPEAVQARPGSLQLFMGRDDWPRLILVPETATAPTYLRYRPGRGWESPRDEQGALATRGKTQGYYGTLGHADPELLCVPEYSCYEKSLKGWTKQPVPGPGYWRTSLVQAVSDPGSWEPWAWQSQTSGLRRLDAARGSWRETYSSPDAEVRRLLRFGGHLVALTASALVAAPDDSAPPSELATVAAPSWTTWARVAEARDMLAVGQRLFVATDEGLLILQSAEERRQLGPLALVDETHSPVALEGTCCLQATAETSPHYFVGGRAGLHLLSPREEAP